MRLLHAAKTYIGFTYSNNILKKKEKQILKMLLISLIYYSSSFASLIEFPHQRFAIILKERKRNVSIFPKVWQRAEVDGVQ